MRIKIEVYDKYEVDYVSDMRWKGESLTTGNSYWKPMVVSEQELLNLIKQGNKILVNGMENG